MLKILHTSDLHLGKSLYNFNRHDEFEKMLDFLIKTIVELKVDVLLLSGDIFDTTMPSNDTQRLYYNFLNKLQQTPLKHTVIIAGNHDSPSFLGSPKILLESFCKLSIVPSIDPQNLDQEVLILEDEQKKPYLIVAAIPYIRERDIRAFYLDEDESDRNLGYCKAVTEHISKVVERAFLKQEGLLNKTQVKVPVVAMAHLFTAGGICLEDDGVRDLFVGTLSHIDATVFDPRLSYVALGHLHVPQEVMKNKFIQYSGTPLAMGFSEKQDKHFCLLSLDGEQRELDFIKIPIFKHLCQVTGNLTQIQNKLLELKKLKQEVLIEIIVEGNDDTQSLQDLISYLTRDSKLKILRIKDQRLEVKSLNLEDSKGQTLEQLTDEVVFKKRLERDLIDDKEQEEYLKTYREMKTMMLEAQEA